MVLSSVSRFAWHTGLSSSPRSQETPNTVRIVSVLCSSPLQRDVREKLCGVGSNSRRSGPARPRRCNFSGAEVVCGLCGTDGPLFGAGRKPESSEAGLCVPALKLRLYEIFIPSTWCCTGRVGGGGARRGALKGTMAYALIVRLML